jgi:hypothetical protein
MKCDRRDSLVTSSETLADALEHHRIEQLRPSAIGTHRQGVGCLFVAQPHLPRPPTLRRFVISCAGHTRLTSTPAEKFVYTPAGCANEHAAVAQRHVCWDRGYHFAPEVS